MSRKSFDTPAALCYNGAVFNNPEFPMFAHFQDLADGYVGPFASEADLHAHVAFCAARGDGGEFLGVVAAVPAGGLVMTPDEDRAWVCPI